MNRKFFVYKAMILLLAISFLPMRLANAAGEESGFVKENDKLKSKLVTCLHKNLIKKICDTPFPERAAILFAAEIGGAHYDENLHALRPVNATVLKQDLTDLRQRIANAIGSIYPTKDEEEGRAWKNSASSVDELMIDAKSGAVIFKKLANLTVHNLKHAVFSCGKNDTYLYKSKHSIQDKMERYAQLKRVDPSQIVPTINDAIRGTIIVENIHELLSAIGHFRKLAADMGVKVVFSNVWERSESAYGGVHTKLLIPIQQNTQESGFVLAEMQFHLRSFFDGSNESPKQKGHAVYEIVRQKLTNDEKGAAEALALVYAPGIKEIAQTLDCALKLSQNEKKQIQGVVRNIALMSLKHL